MARQYQGLSGVVNGPDVTKAWQSTDAVANTVVAANTALPAQKLVVLQAIPRAATW